ncbi:MAG: GAF domain-containing protein [Anaerolineales bacterium]|nr:GAF domain-containing protein [Anaerolineales bacterium]
MAIEIDSSREKAVLTLMSKITSITDLGTLLRVVVQELPNVVGAIGCYIYLQPEYVPEYNGILRRGENEILEENLDDFIVLAATNLDSKKHFIGKAFFNEGEGVTGWVYKNCKPQRIADVTDSQELKSLSADLYWANEYHDGDELYKPGDRRSLLAVPLVLDGDAIGTLKFHATDDKEPFSETSQEIAVIVSQIISGVIRQTWLLAEQSETISQLIETSNKSTFLEVVADVTRHMREMLGCSRSEFFIRSDDGEALRLIIRNGELVNEKSAPEFRRGQNLIGWIFKTGKPLILPNIKQFINGMNLDDESLDKFSVGHEINDEDRFIQYREDPKHEIGTGRVQVISFLAVPIRSKDEEVWGVLCGYRNLSAKFRYPFERSQLILAVSFSSTIALALENERQRRLANLLTKLGTLTQADHLFQTVTENIPKLVASSGCSIFRTESHRGAPYLKLTMTSRKGLIVDKDEMPDIRYELGEGKTGMCGRFQLTLVANHYGNGKIAIERIDREIRRIELEHPNDIVSMLSDITDKKVGLFQLRCENQLSIDERYAVREFAKNIVFSNTGLPSKKMDEHVTDRSNRTWSFIAVPIASDQKLLGVITLARPTAASPFLRGDITLLTSIAGRLASVMNNLRTLEQREQLVMSLGHEINTPLTGILADSENLYRRAPSNTEFQRTAKHNLEQVLRLHMQASAIISVLSEQSSKRQFVKRSLYLPIKEACELFESEAAANGCNILEPRAQEGNFPVIEMCVFDLTIAFKNIVHNAVKYSFRPPANKDLHRTIKISGQPERTRPGFYVISIQNYGVGINSHEIDKGLIFQPYYRGERATDRKRTGSGFGLAHARLVIEELHHGYIRATSIPQGGNAFLTTFFVLLPIDQPK